jgi:hypothetical protein
LSILLCTQSSDFFHLTPPIPGPIPRQQVTSSLALRTVSTTTTTISITTSVPE